jgi:hypothetical protein
MQVEVIILGASITIVSFNLLIVSLFSYWKYRNIKLLFTSVIFFLFLLKGVILSLSLFYELLVPVQSFLYIWVFDLIILVFLYITSLKR